MEVPASHANPIWQFGWLGRQALVLPVHILCARMSNKIYLECLRQPRSLCAVSFAVPYNFIRFLITTLCGCISTLYPFLKKLPKLSNFESFSTGYLLSFKRRNSSTEKLKNDLLKFSTKGYLSGIM